MRWSYTFGILALVPLLLMKELVQDEMQDSIRVKRSNAVVELKTRIATPPSSCLFLKTCYLFRLKQAAICRTNKPAASQSSRSPKLAPQELLHVKE